MSLSDESSCAGNPSAQRNKVAVLGRGSLLAVLVLLLMVGVAKSARADVMFNIIDTTTPSNSGTISFPGLSGADATGVTFSFEGFTESNITALNYSIDPGTDALLSLSLTALSGPSPCNASIFCEATTLTMNLTEATIVTEVCEGGGCFFEDDFDDVIRFSPVSTASVTPEPSSMVLFGSGVLGLWGAVKRRRSS